MMESARGRQFLAEYARRNRAADTAAVLAAIDQIGATLRGEEIPADAPEYLHLGLVAMAALISAVETDIAALATGHETPGGAKPRVQRVIGTLRDLSDCIQVMLDAWKKPAGLAAARTGAEQPVPAPPPQLIVVETETIPGEASEPAGTVAGTQVDDLTDDLAADTAHLALAEAIADYEPDFVPFEIEPLDDPGEPTALTLPTVELFDAPSPRRMQAGAPEPIMPRDPLADLRALSRPELIALFT